MTYLKALTTMKISLERLIQGELDHRPVTKKVFPAVYDWDKWVEELRSILSSMRSQELQDAHNTRSSSTANWDYLDTQLFPIALDVLCFEDSVIECAAAEKTRLARVLRSEREIGIQAWKHCMDVNVFDYMQPQWAVCFVISRVLSL